MPNDRQTGDRPEQRGRADGNGEGEIQRPQQAETPPPQQPRQQNGMNGAEATIALLDSDVDTQKRAQAAQSAASFAGDLLSRGFQYLDQKEQARDQRAQNVDLEPETKYPSCGECGYQFTGDDISLNAETVQCPDCGSVYKITDRAPEAEVDRAEE